MTASKKQIIQRQRQLQQAGWDWDVSLFHAVGPHSGHETRRHYLVKAAIANIIANDGGRFVTEAEHDQRGVADIISLRPERERAVVIEVETDASRDKILAKSEQYRGPHIERVFVIDPTEAPESVDDWGEWLEGELR